VPIGRGGFDNPSHEREDIAVCQVFMQSCALLVDGVSLIPIWTPPVLQAKIVMVLRCNCFRISGFSLDSFSIRAMMEFARKVQIALAALPCMYLGSEPVNKTE